MKSSERLQSATATQGIDYGQFYVYAAPFIDPVPLLEAALSAPPSAGDGHAIVVVSPQQWNFDARFELEMWTQAPPQDSDQWDQASASTIAVQAEDGLWLESATVEPTPLPLSFETAIYAVEACGRESIESWDRESASEPNYEWRLRFWPQVEAD